MCVHNRELAPPANAHASFERSRSPAGRVAQGPVRLRAYRDLFAYQDARWPLVSSTLSRITPGMIALAIVLLVRDGGYGYAVAGVVTAAHQVGVGVASPVQGRLALGRPTGTERSSPVHLPATVPSNRPHSIAAE